MSLVSHNVVILTKDEYNAKLEEAHERGKHAGYRENSERVHPLIEERVFRLKEALLLCEQAASGNRFAWEGSAYTMPGSSGTDLGDRVNRVGEIVNAVIRADSMDDHRGNPSTCFSMLQKYYREHPETAVRSWFGRLAIEKLAKTAA